MCSYVCKEYGATFKTVDYVNTFKGLFLKVEQEIDRVKRKEEEATEQQDRCNIYVTFLGYYLTDVSLISFLHTLVQCLIEMARIIEAKCVLKEMWY